MNFRQETFTPEQAARALEHNESNRNIRPLVVNKYARMMSHGLWGECPQPLVFNGKSVLDGQHRLSAVVKSGKTVTFWVCRAATEEVRKLLDGGIRRTVADVLGMEYGYTHATRIAAIAKWCVLLEKGSTVPLDHFQIDEFWSKRRVLLDWVYDVVNRSATHENKFLRGAYFMGPMTWLVSHKGDEAKAFLG